MKKITKIFVALIMAFVSFVGLTACGDDDKILSAQLVGGTMDTTVVKGETIDTSKAKALIEYKDEYKTVTSDELEFGTVDTSVVGETTMKIKYGDYEFEVKIRVVATEADAVRGISLLESKLIVDFENNRAEQDNKQNEFSDKKSPLYVGDDNPFNFRLRASGRDGSNKLVVVDKVRTNISVELKAESGDTYTTLDADTLGTYVALDTENTTLDFTETAIGREFRVTVEAVNRDLTADEDLTKFTANLTVVDGYNVYNATDLSIYDNANLDNIWAAKKEATGMAGKTANALIFQDNIKVTKDDIPAGYFWNRETDGNAYNVRQAVLDNNTSLQGSLKDFYSTGLYRREMSNGEEFDIRGNYFRLDLSEFPRALVADVTGAPEDIPDKGWVSKDGGKMMTSHMCVFYNTLSGENVEDSAKNITDEKTKITVSNIGFIGNGDLNNNVENSGSIILMKQAWVNFEAYNTLQHNFYIGYFLEAGLDDKEVNGKNTGNYVIDKCKGYNSYQCLFYCWGAENVLIKNSEFLNAGGPAIIASHSNIDNSDPDTGYPTNVNIVASNLHSYVVGDEPWFTKYGANLIMKQLDTLEALYAGQAGLPSTGKSIYYPQVDSISGESANKLDLIALQMAGGSIGKAKTRGYIRVFETVADYDKYYATENAEKTTYGLEMSGEHAGASYNSSLFYLESNDNGGYINSGADVNWDTSYFGFFQAQAVKAIIEDDAFAQLRAGLNKVNIKFSDEFEALTLAEQKAEIKAHINGIKTLRSANIIDDATALQALQGIYLYGFHTNPATSQTNDAIKKDVWTANLELLNKMNNKTVTIDDLVTELCNQVDGFTNVSFAEGDCVNLYACTYGIGVVLGLNTKSSK